jgi:thioredoxin 1
MNQQASDTSQGAHSALHDLIPSLDAAGFATHVLRGRGPIAVEFMSYSCAYCGAMEPVLQQVAETLRSQQAVYKVNVAMEHELASAYAIEGTPTLVMFSQGQELGRAEGIHPDAASVLEALTAPFRS